MGTWKSTEPYYYEPKDLIENMTITIKPDGSFVEQITNGKNQSLIRGCYGTWRIEGKTVVLDEYDLKSHIGPTPIIWNYSSGKLKNGNWTLALIGK